MRLLKKNLLKLFYFVKKLYKSQTNLQNKFIDILSAESRVIRRSTENSQAANCDREIA
jgi:hypothetical protein